MGKTKSHEEFVKEIYVLVGDEYTILGEYEGAKKKILIRHNCAKCDSYQFEMKPNSFLGGQRCPKCGGKLRKNTDIFKEEVFALEGNNYSVLGEYINSRTKIKIRHNCDKCNNYEYEVRPNDFITGYRCPKCSGLMKKDTKQFKQEVYDLVGDEYTVLEEYINARTKTKMKHNCDKCNNYEWLIKPNDFLTGTRCPICANIEKGDSQRKTQEQFEKEVFDLVGDEYTILGEYINSREKILVRHNCNECNNNEYEVTAGGFLSGNRCPICSKIARGKKRAKTQEQFEKEVFEAVGSEYIVLSEYINSYTKIRMKHNCEYCNHLEYMVAPFSFLAGNRCPKCAKSKKSKTKVTK